MNSDLQTAVTLWVGKQFGDDRDTLESGLALAEESGEVCRAILKRLQCEKGTTNRDEQLADWNQAVRDEVADTAIVLLSIAGVEGFDLEHEVRRRLTEVIKRKRATS